MVHQLPLVKHQLYILCMCIRPWVLCFFLSLLYVFFYTISMCVRVDMCTSLFLCVCSICAHVCLLCVHVYVQIAFNHHHHIQQPLPPHPLPLAHTTTTTSTHHHLTQTPPPHTNTTTTYNHHHHYTVQMTIGPPHVAPKTSVNYIIYIMWIILYHHHHTVQVTIGPPHVAVE